MDTEIEAKWLNIDHNEMRDKLNACGATLVQSERLMVKNEAVVTVLTYGLIM